MIPEVNTTCLFTFAADFGALNGAYKVQATTTFQNALAVNSSSIQDVFELVGLTQDNYLSRYNEFLTDTVLILESVGSTSLTIYIPTTLLGGNVPDPTIREYLPLELVVDLGIQKSPQMVLPLITQIKDLIATHVGTEEAARLVTSRRNAVYLTDSAYETIVAARQSLIEEQTPLIAQLQTAQNTITYLSALVKSYEDKILALST